MDCGEEKYIVCSGLTQQIDKLEFGGESPLTMRYERWVINQHPLGPSTISCYENWNLARPWLPLWGSWHGARP